MRIESAESPRRETPRRRRQNNAIVHCDVEARKGLLAESPEAGDSAEALANNAIIHCDVEARKALLAESQRRQTPRRHRRNNAIVHCDVEARKGLLAESPRRETLQRRWRSMLLSIAKRNEHSIIKTNNMAVHKTIPDQSGLFFITFTCWKWMNLFELTNTYDAIYKWFDILRSKGHSVAAYVIMPNHLHGLFGFRDTGGTPINAIVGNGKRFIAYEILKRLQQVGDHQILNDLAAPVKKKEKQRGKMHEVFEPSFDWRKCESLKFTQQKVNYIHSNPCRGKWNLAENPWDYLHSSAQFYHTGVHSVYEVIHYLALEDMRLT